MALYRTPTQNSLQYTLDVAYSAGGTQITLNSNVNGIVRTPGVLVIDRIDSNGAQTASKREYFTFTTVSGTVISGLSGGLAGSTNQAHAVGAIVEFVPDVLWADAIYSNLMLEQPGDGVHASLPSVNNLRVYTNLNVSGASLTGNFPLTPVWVIAGSVSGATTTAGKPLIMPQVGNFSYLSAVLRAPVSGASLLLDINKNGTSIFTDQNTRLSILGGGTYVSTASIGTKAFVSGDILTVDIDNGGGLGADLIIVGRAY